MKGKLGCWILLGATIGAGLSLPGCGGGSAAPVSPPPTPPSAITVSVSPPGPTVSQGATQAFTASVTGTTNTAVTWSVQEGAAGGSITSAGVYTAPSTAGTFHVVAASQADPTKSAMSDVTVAPVSLTVSPTSDTLGPSGQRAFTASVSGTINTGVNWSIEEGAAGGSLTSAGIYTAPKTTGTFHVLVVSAADAKASAEATVMVVSSGFTPAANMETARVGHTATLLPNGKVLIAGGTDGSSTLQSAEIFDPATSNFFATGNMTSARVNHSANLLADGKVLLCGGEVDQGGSGTALTSAELYDPATGTFAATGQMAVARTSHTATLLADGRVLIVGGVNSGVVSSAEIYDPGSGAFTATGSLAFARFNHAAVLLADGKVLVAGGDDVNLEDISGAELYDLVSRTFSVTGTMTVSRTAFTMTLPANGKVLAAGGVQGPSPSCASNPCPPTPLSNVDLYDPLTGTFTAGNSMMAAHGGHTATVFASGKILIAGGDTFAVELFDPASGTFSLTGSLEVARTRHTATLLNDGRVLVTGGTDLSGNVLSTTEIYK